MTDECDRPEGRMECLTVNTWALADIVAPPPPAPPSTPAAWSFTNRHKSLVYPRVRMSLSIRYNYVITSLSPHIVPRNANYARCQHSIARSFSLKQCDSFRFRLFVYSKERLREQNTNMAGRDIWQWGFESQTQDGCVVAVRISMFVINSHELRDSLPVEASCSVPQITKCRYQNYEVIVKYINTVNIFSNIQTRLGSIKWY